MYNYNRDLIYFIKREGTTQNPYNNITENIHVLYEKAFLEEVPVKSFKVVAKVGNTTLTEVLRQQDIKTTNQYYVNYQQGIVYFHSTKNNVLVTLTYRGQGVLLYPASRIYVDSEVGAKDVVKTLRDLIKEGENALKAVQDVNAIILRAETAISQMNTVTTNTNNAITLINNKITEVNTAEASRLVAENTRQTNETARRNSETARANAETTRGTNETARNNAEIARANAETTRSANETTRVNSETIRINSEGNRNTKELQRQTNETARVNAEIARVSAEASRVTVESARVTAESARVTAENNRNTKENERVTNENNRISKESSRVTAETGRVNAELLRQSQETQRQTNSQTAIINLNTAKANAETATSESIQATLDARKVIDDTAFKDTFSSSVNYKKNNIVMYNGSSYIARQDTIGNLPTNQIYWGMIARRGVDGTGTVSSVNGFSPELDGNVVITAESVNAYSKSEIDTAVVNMNNNINGKIPYSEKGVVGGVARLNESGKVVDANGNEVEGKVTSVNGAIGDITGLETIAGVDLKIDNHSNSSLKKHVEILGFRPTTLDKRGVLFIVKGAQKDISESELVDGGLFKTPYDGWGVDGGFFGGIYDGEDIDGGVFDTIVIDAGLFMNLDDGESIDEGLFTSPDDDDAIDGGKW